MAAEERIMDMLMEVAQKRAELPRILARAARKGRVDDVLRLLEDWGFGRRSVSDVYSEALALTAEGGSRGED
ncbi:MAG TPA: hypothetical protein GX513_00100 [Firmicutes bacterium]|nr:hypothetical protein [Bacillota bacterium]